MKHINIEIKARHDDLGRVKNILQSQGADFTGLDHQVDTYFKVNSGRLKLREGNIENELIYYDRENKAEPKQSNVITFPIESGSQLKEILTKSLEVLVVVDKQREIYFMENVKFHLDKVEDLGNFVEIEAIGYEDDERKRLLEQCQYYVKLFKIKNEDLIACSYSDLLLKK